MEIAVGRIFWFEVLYPKTGETEIRPVVILEINNGVPVFVTFVALTHSKIKDFDGRFDKWKVPLFKGRKAGLGDHSFAKVNCVAEVDASSFKAKDYIGEIDRIDLTNIRKKFTEFLDSGEDPW